MVSVMDISIRTPSTFPPQAIFISVLSGPLSVSCWTPWCVHPETAFHKETFAGAFEGVLRDREFPSQARFWNTRLPVTQVSSVWGSGAWGGSRRRVSLSKAEAMGQVSQTWQSHDAFLRSISTNNSSAEDPWGLWRQWSQQSPIGSQPG